MRIPILKITRTKKENASPSNEYFKLRIKTLAIDHIEKNCTTKNYLHHSRCQKIEGYSTLKITGTRKNASPEC